MADSSSSSAAIDNTTNSQSKSDSDNPNPLPAQPDPAPSLTTAQLPQNPNPSVSLVSPQPPPAIPSYSTPPQPISGAATALPPAPPSFRPVPQFSPLPNFPAPGLQPPGVSSAPGSVPPPLMQYQVPPGQVPNPALRPFASIPNGYAAVPGVVPPGLLRYPSPYPAMIRPAFPPRPPGAIGVVPTVPRPPVPGIRPIIAPVIRPSIPNVTPKEKPQTTVYIGKISPSVDNDFMLSLLHLCGPVKSWKRPSNGAPKSFGFCEFESAEGVLRALRLLSKLNIEGQELMVNVNQATKDYLEKYVEKKTENAKKPNEAPAAGSDKEGENTVSNEKTESSTEVVEDSKSSDNKEKNIVDIANSGIVTNEDREADRDASEKLVGMIEERLKTNPLPPPPPLTAPDASGKSNSDVDLMRNDGAEAKNDDETTSESKVTNENDRLETNSPDRRHDRSRDREQDLKRGKEREIERLERETERERMRKEREQRRKIEETEREYEKFLRDWEQREKEKEKQRQYEKEREKERERKRKKEIRYDEEEDDDDDSRKRLRRSILEEKRRKRFREKEDDLADRLKEEKEIAEAKKRAEEQQLQLQQQRDALKLFSGRFANGAEKTVLAEEASTKRKDKSVEQHYEHESSHENQITGDENMQNGSVDESNEAFVSASDTRQSGNVPARKLGFGLVGSGKRTTVPSVFHEEEDDDAQKEKKMRPLVPIDYSTEELQAVQPGAPPPNLVAAAEFAKRISNVNTKEEKPDAGRERSRRSYDKSSRDKDRNDEDNTRSRDETKEKIPDRDRDREHGHDKVKTTDSQKLLDAKQLIDMIPKTKEELFSYEINWNVYDQHALHERMRPWISKKITEFLGEEEKTLVDYIVSSTQEHVKASQMLELLQSILDEEAEMFVLKMWRMLIFEIKKVETGLALRLRS
ncbi:RNA-binding protein 25-like isoform X2 [Hibiscus syriacus]|uniref:RNA-binding protein 25-like isoform X2 n=1 Tax=Hibiscus syriacus TaxID=106335 RepID=UPI001923D40D|nr:RNA-binding protein 25-like isoform X2 [Hibiscus syriacus]